MANGVPDYFSGFQDGFGTDASLAASLDRAAASVPAANSSSSGYNVQTVDYSPGALNPQAQSWDDVFKFGLSRLIDMGTRPVQPNNVIPVAQKTGTLNLGTAGALNLQVLLGWALVIGGGLWAVSEFSKRNG